MFDDFDDEFWSFVVFVNGVAVVVAAVVGAEILVDARSFVVYGIEGSGIVEISYLVGE